jgi:hypothetical protein
VLGHGFFGFGFIIVLLIAIWVATDANKRGMNGVLWAIGVFLLCIVFLPVYLIVRKPLLVQQPYGYPPPGTAPYNTPPAAGQHFCSNCGAAVQPGVKFCAKCGKPV